MKKTLLTVLLVCLVGVVGFGQALTGRNVLSAMDQVADFIEDYTYTYYYTLNLQLYNVAGRLRDADQVAINNATNRQDITINFRNEVLFRIRISRSTTRPRGYDSIHFSDSPAGGYTMTYERYFDIGDQWEIEYIIMNIFESMGF